MQHSLFISMSKIIKHTFNIPSLLVENGELVEGKEITETYTFTLLFKGIGLYEEITGTSLLNQLMLVMGGDTNELSQTEAFAKMTDKKFIKDLACASYTKIVGSKFHNNRATAEEFKKTRAYSFLENDYNFIVKLLSMAMECCYENEKSKALSKGGSKPKPKK